MFADSKLINRALFGVYYEEDIYDALVSTWPVASRALWWRMPGPMRRRGLIFVHVPRAAGTSIVRALYGQGCIRHFSMRYYSAIAPGFAAAAPSFAILRDPVDRFASAYAFVREGGTPLSRLSAVFARATAHIASVDDYLSFLEDRAALDLDFVMRPQSWFVCDDDGSVLVKQLFLYGQEGLGLAAFLKPYGIDALPWLNRTARAELPLTARQLARIQVLYAQDFALVESLRAARYHGERDGLRIAAE